MTTMLSLLKSKKFSPMFFTMLLTAINDNIVKKGLTLYMAYQASVHSYHATLWTSLVSGLFMLPFFLLSTLGGEWADRYSKAKYIRAVKFSEILIVLIVCSIINTANIHPIYYALGVLLMGCHSALFCTAKYSYLPEYLEEHELLAANGLMEAFTLMGIILGISLSYTIQIPGYGIKLISILMICASILGYIISLFIPIKPAADPDIKMTWNIFKGTQSMIDYVHENSYLWASILGISWFWFMGTFFLEQLPNYVRYSLHASPEVALVFNLISTIGIGLGSLFCNTILKGETDLRATPITLFLVSIFGLHFAYGTQSFATLDNPIGLYPYLCTVRGLRLLVDLFGLCFCCGLYLVPLYAKLQSISIETHRSRITAAFNIISSLWMVSANLLNIIFINWLGLTIEYSVSILMIANLTIALYLIRLIPFKTIKPLARRLLQYLLDVEIKGLEHLKNLPERVIIICNHASYLDVPLLACFLPGEYSFAVDTNVAKQAYVRMVKHLSPYYEIDPNNAMKMKSLIRAIQNGHRCIIFPEGRITNTGNIMKIYDGVALLAEKTDASILTLHIDGVNFSITSRNTGHPKRLFPKIRINILAAQKLPEYQNIDIKERRTFYKQWVFDMLSEARAFTRPVDNLYEMLRLTMKEMGSKRKILDDISNNPLSYSEILLKTEILACMLSKKISSKKPIALLLPNVQSKVLTLLALYRLEKIPALLNYSSGAKNMLSACITAECTQVIASRAFIEKASLEETINVLEEHNISIIYLEDLKEQLTLKDKIQGILTNIINKFRKRVCKLDPSHTAAILFTSGSEGSPKGVVLSHANIVTNIHQSMAVADLRPTDLIFNVLPMFHSFGFTLGTWTPLLLGCRVFLFPNPRHYHQVVELIYNSQATIMIGTNTFLLAYQKVADPHDFHSIRNVYAGGEKLSAETRSIWQNKFGIRILEGYGATECSPVVTINTETNNKSGSVGRLLPGIKYRLSPFEGRKDGGILELSGPNIMQGYLYASQPGVLQPQETWYSTGDVVTVDDYGFITIVDRAKRFAKIAGEMISLTAIEHEIHMLWPEYLHAIITISEENKGEKLILLTSNPIADKKALIEHFNANGLSNLALPSIIQHVENIPLLGTGKVDYQALHKLALNQG